MKQLLAVAALASVVAAPSFAKAPEGEQDKPKVEQTGTPRRFLAADYQKGVLAIFGKDGKIEWRTKIKDIHDAWVLPSGNILYQVGWTKVVEITPDNKEVWTYDAAKANEGVKV